MIARMNLEPSPTRQDESRSYQKPAIRPEMTVRQVAADYPPCREIFVTYGEPTDRPGKFGHFQPLTHFARCRDICLDKLLEQLSQAANVPIDRSSGAAERIHRSFIVAALAITLSLGAAWGAWLLWRIGIHQDFDAVAAAHIVAHGEAQLWGFIGFFIVGISLRTVLLDAVRSRGGQYVCIGLFAFALVDCATTVVGVGTGERCRFARRVAFVLGRADLDLVAEKATDVGSRRNALRLVAYHLGGGDVLSAVASR